MPNETGNAAAWNAAAQMATTAANTWSTSRYNKKTRDFNEKWAYINREWAENDWNKQNEYNHPSAQMARLREAGLNPNLVYGNGATTTASPVRGTSSPDWKPIPQDYSGLANTGLAYLDTQTKKANLDNLRSQNTVIQEQAAYLEAQRRTLLGAKTDNLTASTANLNTNSKIGELVAELKKQTFGHDVQYREQQVKKMVADTNFTVDQNSRNAAQSSQSLKEAVQRTLNLEFQNKSMNPKRLEYLNSQIKNSGLAGELMTLEKELKDIGIYPGDPWYTRVAAMAAAAAKKDLKNGTFLNRTQPTGDERLNRPKPNIWNSVRR